jgi:hypothetical protein
MSIELIDAGNRLVDILMRENAALQALDLPRAAAMLAEKQQAVDAFAAARTAAVSAASRPLIELLAHRLQALAEENRLLLERSIAVQNRVIGVVARAASRVVAAPCYGAGGAIACATRPTALALSARA